MESVGSFRMTEMHGLIQFRTEPHVVLPTAAPRGVIASGEANGVAMVTDGTDPRQKLLKATMEHLAKNGVGDLTLRQLAAAIGTSHRMLVYHFGSKEGLLTQVVREVEQEQREAIVRLYSNSNLTPNELIRRAWRHFADPSLWPSERLFFEIYAKALQGVPHTLPLLDNVVEAWLSPMTEASVRAGLPGPMAAADARLAVAVVRGLLLDLLATDDRLAVDQAMEQYIKGRNASIALATGARPDPLDRDPLAPRASQAQ